ncbi:MAG: hypothetical protein EOM67_16490 [Spirochaetia bacterium]|nr:hypothetical protein [Spirochaetia bacterium]
MVLTIDLNCDIIKIKRDEGDKMIKKLYCEICGQPITEDHFESSNGDHICEECGEDFYIHDFTQYDEYPYIDGEGSWDGSMYEGDAYKRVEMEEDYK